jgi:hypothetical protein
VYLKNIGDQNEGKKSEEEKSGIIWDNGEK